MVMSIDVNRTELNSHSQVITKVHQQAKHVKQRL